MFLRIAAVNPIGGDLSHRSKLLPNSFPVISDSCAHLRPASGRGGRQDERRAAISYPDPAFLTTYPNGAVSILALNRIKTSSRLGSFRRLQKFLDTRIAKRYRQGKKRLNLDGYSLAVRRVNFEIAP